MYIYMYDIYIVIYIVFILNKTLYKTFRFALNSFSTVKSLTFATAFTEN